MGYRRWAHVNLSVEKINFDKMISKAKTASQKKMWTERRENVIKLKENPPTYYNINKAAVAASGEGEAASETI